MLLPFKCGAIKQTVSHLAHLCQSQFHGGFSPLSLMPVDPLCTWGSCAWRFLPWPPSCHHGNIFLNCLCSPTQPLPTIILATYPRLTWAADPPSMICWSILTPSLGHTPPRLVCLHGPASLPNSLLTMDVEEHLFLSCVDSSAFDTRGPQVLLHHPWRNPLVGCTCLFHIPEQVQYNLLVKGVFLCRMGTQSMLGSAST